MKASAQWAINGQIDIKPGSKYIYTVTYNGSSNHPYCGEYHYEIRGGFYDDRTYLTNYDGNIDCSGGNNSFTSIDITWLSKTGEILLYDASWNLLTSLPVSQVGYELTGQANVTPGVSYKYSLSYNGPGNTTYCGNYSYYIVGGYFTNHPGSSLFKGNIPCSSLSAMDIDVTWTSNSGYLYWYNANSDKSAVFYANNYAAPLDAGTLSPYEAFSYIGDQAPLIMGSEAVGGGGPDCYYYFWEYSYDDVNWQWWDGGYGSTFQNWNVGALYQNMYLRRGVQDCENNIVYTPSVPFYVYDHVRSVTLSPATQAITAGTAAAQLRCTTDGGFPWPDYYWQSSTDNVNWTDINNPYGTVEFYDPGLVNSKMYYRAIMVNNADRMISNVAVVDVCPALPSITGSTICVKGSTLKLNNSLPGGNWESSNPAVAKVDGQGVVTGVAEGTATISYTITNACGTSRTQLGVNIVAVEPWMAILGKGIDDIPNTSIIPLLKNGSPVETQYDYTGDQSLAHTIKNVLALQVLEETNNFIPGDFTASVDLQIEYGHSSSSVCQPPQQLHLSVNYTKDTGAKYDALNYFMFENAEFTRVTVTNVQAPTTVNGVAFDTKQVLQLTNTLAATRYYQLADNKKPDLNIVVPAPGALLDALEVTWTVPANTGNNGIQLEWAWLEQGVEDEYKNSSNVVDPELLFKAGATRIDLAEGAAGGSYKVPLLYEGEGTLYMRARAVNVLPSGSRSDGPWSDAKTFSYGGHEKDLNWQVTTSYAEEGKRKSVIQYFDGTLRPRQTVTKDNTTSQTVVAETMYDMEGRPAVQVLPVPGINNIIAYTKNLNKFNNQPDNTNPADYFDFTTSTPFYATTPMDDTKEGAAKYYSDKNLNLTAIDQNIPAANGYPYSVTRYMPDGTGRVMRQSAPGDAHKMGSGHETLYFYSTPEQDELDALFGTEVGYKSHYFKNMVQDANGQMNVSYLDMQGRTIATALAGESTQQALSSNVNNPFEENTRNLLSKETNLLKGNSIELVKSMLVPTSTNYKFAYKLNKQTITLPICVGGTVTYDCKFDWEIAIVDETGERSSYGKSFTAVTDIDWSDTYKLPVGSWNVRKTLTINQAWLQSLLAEYGADGKGVCSTLEQLISTISKDDKDNSDCSAEPVELTSSECIAKLGDFETYKKNYAASIDVAAIDLTPAQISDIKTQYDEAVAFCTSLDPEISNTLVSIRKQMLADMVPFTGQYADPERSGYIYDRYNILAQSGGLSQQPYYRYPQNESPADNNYYNDYGSVDASISAADLKKMTQDDFEQSFKSSWAGALLKHHPEYNKLIFAENKLRDAYDFIDKLQFNTIARDPIPDDPFFKMAGQADKGNIVANYIYPKTSGYRLWQLAYGDAFGCKTLMDPYQKNACYSGMPTEFRGTGSNVYNGVANVTLTAAIQSQAWTVYKGLYLQVRNEMVNDYINAEGRGDENEILINENYRLYFPRNLSEAARSNAKASITDEWKGMIPDADGNFPNIDFAGAAASYGHPCDTYINAWRQTLLKCPQLADNPEKEAILSTITTRMLEVCRNGTDGANPYGAASVAPAYSGNANTSFEQVILDVFHEKGITVNEYCHPYGIELPNLHGMNPPVAKQLISTVEPCTCTQWNKLLQEISAANPSASSLNVINDYLTSTNRETITPELYAGLLKCGQSFQLCPPNTDPGPCEICRPDASIPLPGCVTITSIPLLSPQPLPAFLVCGFDKDIPKCYNCDVFVALQASFKTLFGKDPVMTGSVPDDMVVWNNLFAKYVNYKTGLQHDWVYYSDEFNAKKCPIGGIISGETNGNLLICRDDKPLNDATVDNPPGPCDGVTSGSKLKAKILYEYLRQQAIDGFRAAYLEKCLAATETFTVNYQPKEYHYTLYYYDRAGNLVKTIPPKGVQPNYTKSFLDGVMAEREKMKNGLSYTERTPDHILDTRYIYNSLDKVVLEKTPDAGISQFWYDQLGRPAAAQNAKQALAGNVYNYTKYDDFGRIVQTSQLTSPTLLTDATSKNKGALDIWYNNNSAYSSQKQVVQTVYDQGYKVLDNYVLNQENLRNRVAYTRVWNNIGDPYCASATYYTYDVHGNVDALVQDFGNIGGVPNFMNQNSNRFKKIVYDYDLISGKVNQVNYQPGEYDAYYHRYQYDDENRITDVYSGRDEVMLNYFREKEAHYDYYKHGLLASTKLGQLMVQKQDYAYTVNGWIKGVNPAFGGTLANGINTTEITPVTQDAYGFSLHYFDNDYHPIGYAAQNNSILKQLGSGAVPLYNGNIAAMAVNIPKLGASNVYNYHYDQLNRIVAMDAYSGLNIATGSFDPNTQLNDYKERISYDPNGNILSYLRNSYGTTPSMDDLTYHYTLGTNKLHKVVDLAPDASATNYSKYNDIKQGQVDDNYKYDVIGNLTEDNVEGITNITWDSYGKMTSLTKAGVTTTFSYDPAGNRILKVTPSGSTAYVRDNDGNVLSVYTKTNSGSLIQSELHLYGSKRLGIVTTHSKQDDLIVLDCGFKSGIQRTFTRGEKLFELNNHLGNVLVTVTDKRIAHPQAGGTLIDHYEADIVNANDYYPFGMLMPGRRYITKNSNNYRYGFNGKENDNEVKGEGNQQDYGMRVYDPRIGKFLSVDPLTKDYPWYTPYQFAGNTPIWATDLDGAEPNPINLIYDAIHRDFVPNTTKNFIITAATNGFFKMESKANPIARLGRVYEDAVLRSMGATKNTKVYKPALTSPQGVIPDVVVNSILNRLDPSNNKNTQKIIFKDATFTDAKFKGTLPLTPAFNPEQIKIMINILSEQKGGWVNSKWDPNLKASDYGMARLLIVMPSSGILGADLIEYATSKNVKLFQRFTEQDKADPSRIRVGSSMTPVNTVKTEQSITLPVVAPGQSVEVNWNTK
ncbi:MULTISPECIES: DUF6443 domain-containing protein [Niastella]|uniref:Ig-like domain-containing protein n=1 Tax=Niastella soli TaxID=2821487 RepID=A0ABS3Z240_9BACT|nr:RHS repeat-associated core domain-containing protein [Niastella soli]MBO9204218.1 Ig-like domain-containing protein [Niastella soli]